MSLHQWNVKKNDECYTFEYGVEPILKYIPKGSTVWCPFDTQSSAFVRMLEREREREREPKTKVIYSHISEGKDFFEYEPSENYDLIVSNPPFSLKGQVLERLFQLGKPFAIILPINAIFDSQKRFELLKDKDIQLLIPNKRMEFKNEENKTGISFLSVYLCYKMLPSQLEFCELKKVKNPKY